MGLWPFLFLVGKKYSCVMRMENRLEFKEGMEIFKSVKEYFWNCRSKFLAFRLQCNVNARIVPGVR